MAITLDCSPTDSITLSEFVEFVHAVPAPLNLDRLAEIAPHFVRLSRSRGFLSEFIVQGPKDLASFQKGNGYTGQTLMLAEAPGRFNALHAFCSSSFVNSFRSIVGKGTIPYLAVLLRNPQIQKSASCVLTQDTARLFFVAFGGFILGGADYEK